MGRQAMSALLALISGGVRPQVQFDSLFEIVARGSSGPAPRAETVGPGTSVQFSDR
jgi:DNA-binding LacI/PurR family transcriptional regulator